LAVKRFSSEVALAVDFQLAHWVVESAGDCGDATF
jgi:hypothetical protein